jgi:hypothetical protein
MVPALVPAQIWSAILEQGSHQRTSPGIADLSLTIQPLSRFLRGSPLAMSGAILLHYPDG